MDGATNSAILSVAVSTQRRLDEAVATMNATISTNQNKTMAKLATVEASMRRIALQPVVRTIPAPTSTEASPKTTVLLHQWPKNLNKLWHEYEFGIAGGKPAKNYMPKKRGHQKVKFTYSWHNTFWDVILSLVRHGHTADNAIDMIYAAYGHIPVMQILNR